MKKSEIARKIKQKKEAEIQKTKELAPAFYWALKYHKNSRGEAMDFTNMNYLKRIYWEIEYCPRMVIRKSVQTGLSELFIIQHHHEAGDLGLSVMYVLPKYEIRNRFVNNRIYKLHKRAGHYAGMIRQAQTLIHRTSMTHFGKGTIFYVGSNVIEEFVEVPIDSAFVDERDRCNQVNLLMLPDRYTASPYKFHREIGNPTIEGFGIDERYQISSQGEWNIKCSHCGKWFVPDFFKHVIKETNKNRYLPRDKNYDSTSSREISLIHDCGKPVNRLIDGEWVETYRNKEWKGFWISQVFSKYVKMLDLYDEWIDAQGNDTKLQIVYNSRLGIPFSAKGAKITTSMLNATKRQYDSTVIKGPIIIGVDIGAELHYIVREIIRGKDGHKTRLIEAGRQPNFELLGSEVIDKFHPYVVVVDALPEIHKVLELKAKYKKVYSSRFQEGLRKVRLDKDARELQMDRTALIDYVKSSITSELSLLPMNAEFIDGGQYYSHMTSSTRILEIDEKNLERSAYVWVHSRPDHYLLAEGYCFQALSQIPNLDIFEFFEEATLSPLVPFTSSVENTMSEEERREFERLRGLTPEIVTGSMQDRYAKRKK